MLTASDVAAVLGISARAVYDIPETDLPRYRPSAKKRAVRFDPADVAAYRERLQGHRAPSLPMRVVRELVRLQRAAQTADALPSHLIEAADAGRRRLRMAPWANGAAIRAIYAEAKRLTQQTGIQHHVDHEIPLQGERVSGLHVETNLRIVTAALNIRKGNKVQPC
jgi:hypothetical protein